jgi:Zn-dependent protease with chaperone function
MRFRSLLLSLSAAALLAAGAVPALGAPLDSKVGDVRVAYAKKGTVLRADAAITAAPVATLPSGTRVQVVEVKFPWLRVNSVGAVTSTGWLKAFETVEPEAFAAEPPPAHLTAAADSGASGRDVTAAGRQLDAATERGFRATKPDLERGYRLVDAMEDANQRSDAADAIDFVMEGNLGRRGRDALRPARLAMSPYVPDQGEEHGGGGIPDPDSVPGLGGLLGKLGGKHSKDLKKALKFARGLNSFMGRMEKEFSPEQEYYLGRAVAANALARYGVSRDEAMRRHVRLVGDAVVRLTERLPRTVGGWNFEVLDTDEVNGVSGPGGFVLVTRGAVLACEDEDELAGILAHEMAHSSLKHAERLLRGSKNWGNMMGGLAKVAGEVSGVDDSRWGGALVDMFSKSVAEMARTSAEHDFGPAFENEADAEATQLLYDVLYDHAALRDWLRRLATTHPHGGSATHAPPDVRASYLDAYVGRLGPYMLKADAKLPRTLRFRAVAGKPPPAPAAPPLAPPPAPPPTPAPVPR